MIEKICNYLTRKIKEKTPDMDFEKEEIINYGLQIIVGEIPKTIALIVIAIACGVLKLSLLALILMVPYRMVSGGVHLKSHIACIVSTTCFYTGNALISKSVIIPIQYKICLVIFIWIFSVVAIKKYAPADTEAVPILRKKDRDLKRNLSYITMTLTLVIAIFIGNSTISNLLIFGTLLQTISITKFIYKLTKSKYGYLKYIKQQNVSNVA